jgi:hypothetical protein
LSVVYHESDPFKEERLKDHGESIGEKCVCTILVRTPYHERLLEKYSPEYERN